MTPSRANTPAITSAPMVAKTQVKTEIPPRPPRVAGRRNRPEPTILPVTNMVASTGPSLRGVDRDMRSKQIERSLCPLDSAASTFALSAIHENRIVVGEGAKPMSIQADLTRATTLPAAWYGGDKDIWEKERRSIFAREWLMVGRADEAPDPGSYLTAEIAGWPVFVIRDRAG